MVDLPWNINIIDWLLQNRTDILTNIFLFFTFLGDSLGYIIIVITIYWLYDKKVAIKVTFALILSLIFNQILKNIKSMGMIEMKQTKTGFKLMGTKH